MGAGFVFRITAAEDIYNAERTVKHYSQGDVVGRITTTTAGVATKSGLPLGRYLVDEESVTSGYLLNTETKNVTLNYKDEVTPIIYGSVTFSNDEPTGTLEITKDDVTTGNNARADHSYKHGDASIAGTEYTLFANEKITNVAGTVTYFEKNDVLATYTFNKEGVAEIKITNSQTPADLTVNGVKLEGIPMGSYRTKRNKDGRTVTLQIKQFIFILSHIKICIQV